MGYELLDDGLTKSTLWLFGSKDAKILFVTILSECHGSDIVRVPIPVLVKLAGLTREEGDAALAELESTDPDSRCPAEDGRRIVRVEDEQGKGLHLPSFKSRRNRFLGAERKRSFNERNEVRTPENGKERPGTPENAEFDLKTKTKTKTKTGGEERASRFAPPSLSDVREFGKELPGLNAEAFFDFYASKGWKVGAQPMKDWKAAARNWRRRDGESGKIPTPKPKREDDLYLKRLAEVRAEDAETERLREERGL